MHDREILNAVSCSIPYQEYNPEDIGYIESKEELIKGFDDNKDAKQLIDGFLQQ